MRNLFLMNILIMCITFVSREPGIDVGQRVTSQGRDASHMDKVLNVFDGLALVTLTFARDAATDRSQ